MDKAHAIGIIVDDMKVKLDTERDMLPKDLVEYMMTELLKETQDKVPRSKMEAHLKGYVEYLEHNRNLWRFTALAISAIFFLTSILRLVKC